jgi:hypothetical protein
MDEEVHEEVTTTSSRTTPTTDTHVTRTAVGGTPSGLTVAARAVYLIVGIIEILLIFRFILALLGANRGADFAQFIFDLSTPFVAPFMNLFNFQTAYGTSRLEVETLVAMAVYAVLGWIIVALIALPSRRAEV